MSTWTKLSSFITPVDSINIQYATLQHLPTTNDNTPTTTNQQQQPQPNNKNRNSIVFFTGWKETFHKHYPLLRHLHDNYGFDIYTMDFRSQGFSDDNKNLVCEKGHEDGSGKRICHVDDFEKEYVADARYFIEEIVYPLAGYNPHDNNNNNNNKENKALLSILSFSMGGLISTRLSQLGISFDRLILISPMFRHKTILNLGPLLDLELPLSLSRATLTLVVSLLGLSTTKADGRDTDARRPVTEALSHCTKRLEYWNKLRRENPRVVLAGVSFGWVAAAFRLEDEVMEMAAADDGKKKKIPTLIFQSEDDAFVYRSSQEEYARRVGREYCRLIGPIEGTYHELLYEEDRVRQSIVESVALFCSTPLDEAADNHNEMSSLLSCDEIVKALERVPVLKDETGGGDGGGSIEGDRWPRGYHSGVRPPDYVPVPLIMKDSPERRHFLCMCLKGAALAVVINGVMSLRMRLQN